MGTDWNTCGCVWGEGSASVLREREGQTEREAKRAGGENRDGERGRRECRKRKGRGGGGRRDGSKVRGQNRESKGMWE